LVDGFDPALTGARDAMELVAEFSRLEHLASAGVALGARRVAQTDLWKRAGFRSAAHWLDHVTGMGVGDAVRPLQAAEAVDAAPDTLEALKAGKVSTREAKAIGAAEAADPDAGRKLLADLDTKSTKETETDAARIVAAASTESPEAKAERHRKARRVFHGVNADGMGYGSWLLPIAEHTRIVARLEGERAKVFDQARSTRMRDTADAYTADAFCRVFGRAVAIASGSESAGGAEVVEEWSFTKMIVRVDLAALDRGELAPGEVCEIAGQGPIPVADVWRMIDGDAFVAAVTTRGTEIDKVVHLGRKPTVLQRTALEWFSAGECSIDGCTSPARIEIDHVADWADTKITTLPDLASPCGHHHDLKTRHGYTFGPRLGSGKRRLIPPDESPPGSTDPPGLTLLACEGTDQPPLSPATTQGDLFDTG
jgi:hypothetical protein